MRTVWSWMARKNDPTRERRMLWNYGGPDLPRQQPEALPSGERLEKQISSKLDSARSLQGRVGGSQEMQKKTFNAIQANMKRSEEIGKTTYQTGVTYRLGSGAGPGGMGMSEGFRRAMPDPTVGPQYAMNNLPAWGGGDMDYAGLMERGYSMGPRRGPPPIGAYPSMMPMPMGAPQFAQGPYMQQMSFGPNGGEQMFLGSNMGPDAQWGINRPQGPRRSSDSPMQRENFMRSFLASIGRSPEEIEIKMKQFADFSPAVQQAFVTLFQQFSGPDGQAIRAAVTRITSQNGSDAFDYARSLAAALEAAPAALGSIVGYLRARASGALPNTENAVQQMPEPHRSVMREFLSVLQPTEAIAILNFLPTLARVGSSIGYGDLQQLRAVSQQQYSKMNAQPPAEEQFAKLNAQPEAKQQFNKQNVSAEEQNNIQLKLAVEEAQKKMTQEFQKSLPLVEPDAAVRVQMAEEFSTIAPVAKRLILTMIQRGPREDTRRVLSAARATWPGQRSMRNLAIVLDSAAQMQSFLTDPTEQNLAAAVKSIPESFARPMAQGFGIRLRTNAAELASFRAVINAIRR